MMQPQWLKPHTLPQSAKATAQEYDKISKTYEVFTQGANYQSPQACAELLQKWALRDDNRVSLTSPILDAGCGTGLVGLEIARKGFSNVIGIDVSKNVLKEAASKAVYTNLIQGNLLATLPFTDTSFSAVLCIGVFSRFERSQILDILNEFSRITQRSGLILFSHREDLLNQSRLQETLTRDSKFEVICITSPSPYIPNAVGYENLQVQYILLKNQK
jgi:ubiquinone/menaquinone biosynthesis C-methylase UbiE